MPTEVDEDTLLQDSEYHAVPAAKKPPVKIIQNITRNIEDIALLIDQDPAQRGDMAPKMLETLQMIEDFQKKCSNIESYISQLVDSCLIIIGASQVIKDATTASRSCDLMTELLGSFKAQLHHSKLFEAYKALAEYHESNESLTNGQEVSELRSDVIDRHIKLISRFCHDKRYIQANELFQQMLRYSDASEVSRIYQHFHSLYINYTLHTDYNTHKDLMSLYMMGSIKSFVDKYHDDKATKLLVTLCIFDGKSYLENKKYPQVIECANILLSLQNSDQKSVVEAKALLCSAHDALGTQYWKDGQYEDSAQQFALALQYSSNKSLAQKKLDDAKQEIYIATVRELIKNARYHEAIDHFKRALKDAPLYEKLTQKVSEKECIKLRDACIATCTQLTKDGRYAGAVDMLKDILKCIPPQYIKPDIMTTINQNLGKAYTQDQRYKEAIDSFKSALKTASSEVKISIERNILTAYRDLGEQYFKNQKYTEAIAVFKDGLKHQTQSQQSKATQGKKHLNEDLVKVLYANLAKTYHAHGAMLFDETNYTGAIATFEQALKHARDPEVIIDARVSLSIAYHGLSLHHHEKREYREAVAAAQKAFEYSENSVNEEGIKAIQSAIDNASYALAQELCENHRFAEVITMLQATGHHFVVPLELTGHDSSTIAHEMLSALLSSMIGGDDGHPKVMPIDLTGKCAQEGDLQS